MTFNLQKTILYILEHKYTITNLKTIQNMRLVFIIINRLLVYVHIFFFIDKYLPWEWTPFIYWLKKPNIKPISLKMWNKLFKSKSKKIDTTTNKSKSFLCRSKNKKNDPTVGDHQQKCGRNAASTSSTTGRLIDRLIWMIKWTLLMDSNQYWW